MQHNQIAGNPLEHLLPLVTSKDSQGTQLITGSNGKKINDWAIRSQAPKFALIEYGEGSTTRWLWDGKELINPL